MNWPNSTYSKTSSNATSWQYLPCEKLNDEIQKLTDNDNTSDLENQITGLENEVNMLKSNLEWLVNYAKSTDNKVKEYFNGNTEELSKHNNWLVNMPKDEKYMELFGYNSEDNSTVINDNKKTSDLQEKNEENENKTEKKINRRFARH